MHLRSKVFQGTCLKTLPTSDTIRVRPVERHRTNWTMCYFSSPPSEQLNFGVKQVAVGSGVH